VTEVLVYFDEPIFGPDAKGYSARACAREEGDRRWCGWLEFSADGEEWFATPTETVQPNRRDVEYWVTGLTRVYLQGALSRAREVASGGAGRRLPDDLGLRHPNALSTSLASANNRPRTILDPFTVYAQGEGILRAQLSALSQDQLRNISAAFSIESPETASGLDARELCERIVLAARDRASRPVIPELRA